MEGMITSSLFEEYLKRLLAGDRSHCSTIVNELLTEETPVRIIYTDLFQRSLYQVGDLWEHNHISVAEEHLATAVTESLLSLVYPKTFATPRLGYKAVVACTPNEYHQLGGKIVADLLELRGWDAHFLGANTPVQDLLSLVEKLNPDFLALSLAVYSNLNSLGQTLQEVRGHFPELLILVGGQAFRWGKSDFVKQWPEVIQPNDLSQLENFLESRFPA